MTSTCFVQSPVSPSTVTPAGAGTPFLPLSWNVNFVALPQSLIDFVAFSSAVVSSALYLFSMTSLSLSPYLTSVLNVPLLLSVTVTVAVYGVRSYVMPSFLLFSAVRPSSTSWIVYVKIFSSAPFSISYLYVISPNAASRLPPFMISTCFVQSPVSPSTVASAGAGTPFLPLSWNVNFVALPQSLIDFVAFSSAVVSSALYLFSMTSLSLSPYLTSVLNVPLLLSVTVTVAVYGVRSYVMPSFLLFSAVRPSSTSWIVYVKVFSSVPFSISYLYVISPNTATRLPPFVTSTCFVQSPVSPSTVTPAGDGTPFLPLSWNVNFVALPQSLTVFVALSSAVVSPAL